MIGTQRRCAANIQPVLSCRRLTFVDSAVTSQVGQHDPSVVIAAHGWKTESTRSEQELEGMSTESGDERAARIICDAIQPWSSPFRYRPGS